MKAESDDDIISFNRTVRKSAKSLLGMQALVVELVSRTGPITREHLTNLASELLDCYKDPDIAVEALRDGRVVLEKLS
jgi:hypothetical protein